MPEIKCPNCGQVIKIDKSSYDALLSEIEKDEIESRVKSQVSLLQDSYKAKLDVETLKIKSSQDTTIADLNSKIKVLEEKLNNKDKDVALAVSDKNQEIEKLKGELLNIKKDKDLELQELKKNHDFAIKAKDEEIKKYRDFRMGDSTKDLGESLEKYCEDSFNEIRSVAYPNAYFEKDTENADGTKGDFIFRDFSEDKIEFVSIMFEMKNQKDDTEHKHKNSDFYKKLDQDRNKKGCEYAVLVSTLEEDSKLFNSGIVDVSYRYEKMFVVRPQFFLAIIGLIRNMALKNLADKRELIAYKKENLDITRFEENVMAVRDKIFSDYEQAGQHYDKVEKMCDDMIKKLTDLKEAFRLGQKWIGTAQNRLPELEIRKLTKDNPTMKAKFEELDKNK